MYETTKKLALAFVQIVFMAERASRGQANWGIRRVECGWPGSNWQSRHLVIGQVKVRLSDISVEMGGGLYPLGDSPQKELFRKLDQKVDLAGDPYFEFAKSHLSQDDFAFWLHTKKKLWSEYDSKNGETFAVAVRAPGSGLLVQDGAHRLALKSLRGELSCSLSISLWTLK